MFKSLFKKKPSKNPVKPIIKPITEFPAKILIINSDNFDNCSSQGQFLNYHFSEGIENNLYEFYLARDFIEASKQITLFRPDLILCEMVVTPVRLVPYTAFLEFHKFSMNSPKDFYEIEFERRGYGHGLKIFEVLKMLKLDYRIPVIFWAILAEKSDYKNKAMQLGAMDCIELKNDKNTINQSIRKCLGIPETLEQNTTVSQVSPSINNLQDQTKQAKKKPGIYQKIKTQGIKQGQASLILLQLKKRIGEIKSEDENRITKLEAQQLEALGLALLDFSNYDDLIAWLANS